MRCKVHEGLCHFSEEHWIIDQEDDCSDDEQIRQHNNSFPIREVCLDVLLEYRRHRGVGVKDQGKVLDQFTTDLGSTVGGFDEEQSSCGCRIKRRGILHRKISASSTETGICGSNSYGARMGTRQRKKLFQDPNLFVTMSSMRDPRIETLNLSHRETLHNLRADVFARLPEELQTEILSWLPSDDVAALRLALRSISQVQLSARFW